MGVNLVYGAFYKHNDPKRLLRYLYDHIDTDGLNAGFLPIEIDTINFSGPVFKDVDNRLMSLELIRNGMTDAVMFDSNGNNILPARILYKKNILALRGSFRPVTKVNIDMFEKSFEIFQKKIMLILKYRSHFWNNSFQFECQWWNWWKWLYG